MEQRPAGLVRRLVGQTSGPAMAADGRPRPRIVVVGAGYAGLFTARRLQSRLGPDEASVTVVDTRPYMTYQPFLPEAAAGTVEPRHVVAPLRLMLGKCDVLTGTATSIDTAQRSVQVRVSGGHVEQLTYDFLVVTPGSVTKTLPVPGLQSEAIGFTTIGEAIYLRNQVLSQLDQAAGTRDRALRRKLLTFLFVGGGYAGIEALGALEEMARFAARRYYGSVGIDDMRWVLVEATDRIMPEVSLSLAEYSVDVLRSRGIEVTLSTTVETMEDGHIVLADGTTFDAGTIVWTAGVKPHPMLAGTDLPLDEKGRVRCRPTLQVEGHPQVFAGGDCAAVPDLSSDDEGALCPPTAQHAVRQARQLGDNLVAMIRHEPGRNYRHASTGSVASLGLHDGVAEVYGVKVKGWPAWALHRLYHLSQMPTVNRRVRLAADLAIGMPFPRQVVSLGELQQPRAEFTQVATH